MHAKIHAIGKWQCAVPQESDKSKLCPCYLWSFFPRWKTGPGMFSYHCFCIALYYFLDFMAHRIIDPCKHQKPTCAVSQQVKGKENFILVYFSSNSGKRKQQLIECAAFLFAVCVFSCSWILFCSFGSYGQRYFLKSLFMTRFSNLWRKVMSTGALYTLGKGISRWDIHKVLHNKFSPTTISIHQM